jgi:hypothetical protein
MALSGFVDLIVCKMDFAAKQNVTKVLGVGITHTAGCQPANHAHRLKMLNALDMVRIQSFCV